MVDEKKNHRKLNQLENSFPSPKKEKKKKKKVENSFLRSVQSFFFFFNQMAIVVFFKIIIIITTKHGLAACPPLSKALGFDWACSSIQVPTATTPCSGKLPLQAGISRSAQKLARRPMGNQKIIVRIY